MGELRPPPISIRLRQAAKRYPKIAALLEEAAAMIERNIGDRGTLTAEQVAEIRAAPESVTTTELARRFGVNKGTISRARRGESWE